MKNSGQFNRVVVAVTLAGVAGAVSAAWGSQLAGEPKAGAPEVRFPGDDDEAGRTIDAQLENGFRIVTRVHGVGRGEVTFWLRVEVGSGHERALERGAAHLSEHLSLTGPEAGQAGHDAVAQLGIEIGKRRNAYTNADHSAYWIVTDGSAEEQGRALAALATVLKPQPASEQTLDRERGVVIDEWINSESPETRAQRKLLTGLFPGTSLAEHWPGVEPKVMAGLSVEVVNAFRERTYTVRGATLLIVGDVDAATVSVRAAEVFGGLEGGAPAGLIAGGLDKQDGVRAVRAEQEGLGETEITIAWAGRTDRESRVCEELAVAILRERVKRLTSETEGWAGTGLVVLSTPLPAAAEVVEGCETEQLGLVQIAATFPPTAAAGGLTTLAMAVSGMSSRPVTSVELGEGIETLISSYEWAAKNERARSTTKIASKISSGLPRELRATEGERLRVARQELGEIQAARVTNAARAMFDVEGAVLLAQGPPGKLPSSAALLAEYRLGVRAVVGGGLGQGQGEADAGARFFVEPPLPCELERVSLDQRAGVFDAVLSNGMRLRHKQMTTPDGRVILRVSLGRATLGESVEEAGLTLAAAEALAQRPATVASPGKELALFLDRRGVSIEAEESDGSIDLVVKTPLESLDESASLVAALLTEPSLAESDLRWWRSRARAVYDETRADPALYVISLLDRSLDPEGREPEIPVGLEALERDRAEYLNRIGSFSTVRARARIMSAAAESPVTVTVVGDCTREQAVEAVTRSFSALPDRNNKRAAVGELCVPASVTTLAETTRGGDRAAATVAVTFDRRLTVREVRQLVTATNILDGRLREIEGLKPIGREYQRATIAYSASDPGRVSLVVLFTGRTGEMDALTQRVSRVFEVFGEHGPTAQELEEARRRMVKVSRRAVTTARFWSSRLSDDALGDRSLDGVMAMSRDYAEVTAVECRELVREAMELDRVSIRAVPSTGEAGP